MVFGVVSGNHTRMLFSSGSVDARTRESGRGGGERYPTVLSSCVNNSPHPREVGKMRTRQAWMISANFP